MLPRLMIPGPVDVDDAVLAEMSRPLRAHYGADWVQIYNETADLFKQAIGTMGDAYLMPGSGTLANDAALGSLVATAEKAIVGVNGFFGGRLAEIVREYGGTVIEVTSEWGQALSPDDFAAALRQHPDAAAVAVVQLETSTGVLNPVREIAAVAQAAGVPIVMDGVSSIGGVEFAMDEWGVGITVTAPQKCLGAPPGLGLLAVASSVWPRIEQRANQPHGWYCNLNTWRWYQHNWADWHPYPMTLPVNNILALRESLRQLLAEGLERRIARYRSLAERLRRGLQELGMPPVVPEPISAPVMTAAWGPPGVPTSEIVRFVEVEYGIKISGGLGIFKDRVFRIGHMSPTMSPELVDRLLGALADFSKRRR